MIGELAQAFSCPVIRQPAKVTFLIPSHEHHHQPGMFDSPLIHPRYQVPWAMQENVEGTVFYLGVNQIAHPRGVQLV